MGMKDTFSYKKCSQKEHLCRDLEKIREQAVWIYREEHFRHREIPKAGLCLI